MSEIKWLEYYHTNSSSMYDKDLLKNNSYSKYQQRVGALMAVPMFFQFWQISLTNNLE